MDKSINSIGAYYFDDNSILKFLRKVLAEINPGYVDCGVRSAFILKRYIEKYKVFEDPKRGPRLALLCMLKDIGTYYKSGEIPRSNHALAAASSYAFMHNCSPFGLEAKPVLFYQSKFIDDTYDPDQKAGLLMSLVNQIVEYNYQEYTIPEMHELIKNDKRGIFDPDQVKKLFDLLKQQPDIYEKMNDKNSLFVYETSKYISSANYSFDELMGFVDMATFAFEFHNNETLAHTVTVAAIAEELARLSKLPDSMIAEIRLASLIHDIGKIRVPLEILCYPGKLNDQQFAEMKKHVEYTREICTGCFSYKIVDIAAHHHEKLDGSGYPERLRERDLSVGDKIIAIADIASALYCKRSYKNSLPDEKIQEILKSDVDKGKLDKRIFNHLITNWDEIFDITKGVEKYVIDQYNAMRQEYAALSKSKVLFNLFDYQDDYVSIFDPEPEIQYVDEAGNPLTKEEASEIAREYVYESKSDEQEIVEEEIVEDVVDETEEVEEIIEEPIEVENNEEELDDEAESNENVVIEESENEKAVEEIVFDLNEDEQSNDSENEIDDEFDAYMNSLSDKKEIIEESTENIEEEIVEELTVDSDEAEDNEDDDFDEEEDDEDDDSDEEEDDEDDDFDEDEDDEDDDSDEEEDEDDDSDEEIYPKGVTETDEDEGYEFDSYIESLTKK